MSNLVDSKVQNILDAINSVNNQVLLDCEVERREDGSSLIYGPFPSFLILVEALGNPRALIHVNADAANLVYLFQQINKTVEVVIDGPFAVDEIDGVILQGPEAYTKKEANILKFAEEILERRLANRHEKPAIVVPEKKIILAS